MADASKAKARPASKPPGGKGPSARLLKLLDIGLYLLIPALVLVHLAVAPHTKVEESFNIQAAHDILVYGTPTTGVAARLGGTYDHFTFPGAVPRTFVGAVLLAGIGQPVVQLVGFRHAQLVVRGLLGLSNAACLLVFARGVGRSFGPAARRWFLLFTAGQFHVIFYASRTLPNMFAFGLTTLAFSFLLPAPDPSLAGRRQRQFVSLFVFATAVFRSELALLLASTCLYLLVTRQTTITRLIPPFLVSFSVALLVSVPIDSYFWQRPLWPELWGFYYNAVQGKSADWGVSPWHYYFSSALPRILLNPLLPLALVPLALAHPATRRTAAALVAPCLAFVAAYSLQPHKEARFVFYVAPPLTAAAAQAAALLSSRAAKSAPYRAAAVAVALSALAAVAASSAMLLLSALNYPGGDALAQLYALARARAPALDRATVLALHADVLACMTGVTLFGLNPAGLPLALDPRSRRAPAAGAGVVALDFDRSEERAKLRDPRFWKRFDYLLVEDRAAVRGGRWDVVGAVQGYAGVEIVRPDGKPLAAVEVDGDGAPIVGRGLQVARVKAWVRRLTGGWWVGPRMETRIRILKQRKEDKSFRDRVLSA